MIFRSGLLDWSDRDDPKDAGAVADILCRFVDGVGTGLGHTVNQRAFTINPRELRKVSKVIISSGGQRKAAAIRADIRHES